MSLFLEPQKTVCIKSDEAIKTRWVGMRACVVIMAVLGIAVHTLGIWNALEKSNALKENEIKIQKEQLDLARRQFQLDSIAAAQNQKIR